MINTVPGSLVFENTREMLTLCRERLKKADSWADLIDDANEDEELAMRQMPELLAEILQCYDNL